MPKAARNAKKRGASNKLRAGAQPYTRVLPDPKRPDLLGLKPGMVKKLQRKKAFLKAVGASHAAAANDLLTLRRRRDGAGEEESAGAALGSGWADLGAMLEATSGPGSGSGAKALSSHSHPAHARVTSNSAKQVVATKEVERLKAVASHPAFQQDPHAALREHLKTTIAAQVQAMAAAQQRGAADQGQGQQAQGQQKQQKQQAQQRRKAVVAATGAAARKHKGRR